MTCNVAGCDHARPEECRLVRCATCGEPYDGTEPPRDHIARAHRRPYAQGDPVTATTRRLCSFLTCPQSYNAVAVMDGTATAAGWRRWNPLGLLLCPNHAHLWQPTQAGQPGPHQPRLDGAEIARGPVLRCACGWDQDTAALTAGKVAEAYLVHLLRVDQADAARAAFDRAGISLADTATLDAVLAEIADKATGSHAIAKRNFYADGELGFPAAYAALCDLLAVTAACRAALGMEPTPTATDLMDGEHRKIGPHVFALDGAAHSVWLHGKWQWLTKNMTTEEREAFADAVERYSACLEPGDPLTVDRWWREPAAAVIPEHGR